jgi:glutathione S-transferase
MSTVLRIFANSDIIASHPQLNAYIARCTARPAFQRALNAQLADFREAA